LKIIFCATEPLAFWENNFFNVLTSVYQNNLMFFQAKCIFETETHSKVASNTKTNNVLITLFVTLFVSVGSSFDNI
jgi:hypothetical protein